MNAHAWRTLVPTLATLLFAACSSTGTREPETVPAAGQPAGPPVAAPDLTPHQHTQVLERLRPPAAAVRSAETVDLTGLEMGTMWTFEHAPLDSWETAYGFRPDPAWLEHVRLASLRYGRVCSASFVSPDGLVLTNNHCARRCIDDVSTGDADHLNQGFYAATRDEELVCPDLYLDQLAGIEDVTSQVLAAVRPEMSAEQASAARLAMRGELDARCEAESGLTCEVVSLFHGGQYQLYTYRRYAPVKLVFAPEHQAGSFGGDPDNFTYPRYDLDITFVRAYVADGVPASTPHYFRWDPEGAREGELVFVTGNPGSTSRQIALSEYLYEREARHPILVEFLDARLEVLHAIAAEDAARGRELQTTILSLENSQKLYRGQLAGLRDTLLTAKKIAWERTFRDQVSADPVLQAEYGDVWDRLEAINAAKAHLYPRLRIYDHTYRNPSEHLRLAGDLERYPRQMAMPEAQRDEAFRGDSLVSLEARFRTQDLIPVDQSAGMLAGRLAIAARWLPASDPLARAVLPGETPETAARRLIASTRIGEAAYRSRLFASGARAIETADDPLVNLVREMAAIREPMQAEWDRLEAEESLQTERFAKALFAVFGTDLPPDATFTLRISDGVVKRYVFNGTYAPAQTTLYGLYARAAEFGNEPPWNVPRAFEEARDRIDMAVPINFVSTNDITGGNSGSPVIDREARVVGVAFDGNVEAFPNEFLFASENGRTVSVHTAGITEALRRVYRADALVQEILQAADQTATDDKNR